MAEIDYGIAAKIAPPQFDPMAVAGKAMGLQQGMIAAQQGVLNNRLLGQQIGGKEALGRAITGATNPTTGQTDWAKGLGMLSQDPQGAFAVPELAASVQDRQLKELGISKAELELSRNRWTTIGDTTMPLLATKEPLTRDAVIKSLTGNLIDSGMFNDEKSIGMLAKFVQGLPDEDKGLREKLQGLALASNNTQERINSILGPVERVDTGPGIAVTQTSPLTGKTTVQSVIDKGLSPSEANTPAYTYKDATGVEHIVTKAQAAAAGSSGVGGGSAPAGITSGSPYGTAEAANATAAANVAQAQSLQQRAAIVPQRRAALTNMVDALGDFLSGPKAGVTYNLGALATMSGKASPSVVKGVAAQEEFNKLAAQVALDQWGALGGSGSNDQLATSIKANPNDALSRLGNKNVIALLQGNEDAIGAQFQAWQKYSAKNGPGSYGKFLEGWNRYYDPRVFQAQHMDPAAVKVMKSKMTPDQLKKFNRDLSIATQAGWLGGQ